jgi:hypothetical protein
VSTAFKASPDVTLTKSASGIYTFKGKLGSFTAGGKKYDIDGGYITVPAMHTIGGKRHKMEIALTGTGGGKHATYVVLGENDEVGMDIKFLEALGWEGLEEEGTIGELGVGGTFHARSAVNPNDLKGGAHYFTYEGHDLASGCKATTFVVSEKVIKFSDS